MGKAFGRYCCSKSNHIIYASAKYALLLLNNHGFVCLQINSKKSLLREENSQADGFVCLQINSKKSLLREENSQADGFVCLQINSKKSLLREENSQAENSCVI